MKFFAAVAIAFTFILPAQAQPQQQNTPLPKIVQDAIDENKKQCEDGETVSQKPGLVTKRDINGDGVPDYILDYEHLHCGELPGSAAPAAA